MTCSNNRTLFKLLTNATKKHIIEVRYLDIIGFCILINTFFKRRKL